MKFWQSRELNSNIFTNSGGYWETTLNHPFKLPDSSPDRLNIKVGGLKLGNVGSLGLGDIVPVVSLFSCKIWGNISRQWLANCTVHIFTASQCQYTRFFNKKLRSNRDSQFLIFLIWDSSCLNLAIETLQFLNFLANRDWTFLTHLLHI